MSVAEPTARWIRLAVGLLQGLALYLLYVCETSAPKIWPATDGLVFAPLVTAFAFVPLIVISGMGHLRLRVLLAWSAVATLLCVGLAAYDIFRDPINEVFNPGVPRTVPSAQAWWSLAAVLFILHALVRSCEQDRKLVASYSTYFSTSWTLALQSLLTAVFTALFWGVLFLGASLFELIKINSLSTLIRRTDFWIPVTALAVSSALHVTDVRSAIVLGSQRIGLALMAWLLPLTAVLGAAFLVALPFTGLSSLWETRSAARILLGAAAVLIILINATHQDGRPDIGSETILRYAMPFAAIVIAPLIALAGFALAQRIEQYGWTAHRVVAAAGLAIAACYGSGYVFAAVRFPASMRTIEPTNLFTSAAIVVVLLALNTPVADPARIAVADQLHRLQAGTVPLERFDFRFLRFDAGRYGRDALQQLAAHAGEPNASAIATRAAEVLQAKGFASVLSPPPLPPPITPEQVSHNIIVTWPEGATLPEDLVHEDWSTFHLPWLITSCFSANRRCGAVLADLDGDGIPEVVLFDMPDAGVSANTNTIVRANLLHKAADGHWTNLGLLMNSGCPGVGAALAAGHVEVAEPQFKDLLVNGQRLHMNVRCAPTP
jgi:hypothetical protein